MTFSVRFDEMRGEGEGECAFARLLDEAVARSVRVVALCGAGRQEAFAESQPRKRQPLDQLRSTLDEMLCDCARGATDRIE